MKFIFSNYQIAKENSFFVFDSYEENQIRRVYFNINENAFSLTRYKPRFCIGRYDLNTLDSFPCPNRKELGINIKHNTCFDCSKYNAFNPSFYNVKPSDLSIKQQTYNSHQHNVYLVAFSENHVKVGISHHERTLTRWLEQGARVATIIYKCNNAYEARAIEIKIVKELKLPETFRSDFKKQLISDPFNLESIIKRLNNHITEIEDCIGPLNVQQQYSDLTAYYCRNNILNNSIIDLSNESPLIISGISIALIGDVFIFRNDKRHFMVSLKKFMSHLVDFEENIINQKFTATQTSLF